MADHAYRRATYADLEAVPPHLVAEIIGGELVTYPRPAPRHAATGVELAIELGGPYGRGRGGPGGWIFLAEPELHLRSDVVVPDLAGWRRERLPVEPETAYIEVAPDWVCEISSPSTRDNDRGAKRTIYAAAGIGHLWLLDPQAKMPRSLCAHRRQVAALAYLSGAGRDLRRALRGRDVPYGQPLPLRRASPG
jgi:Uma2 family endonuclease